jgi:subtilase family serine protease
MVRVVKAVMPDLAMGLIKVRDATQRSADEGVPPYVVELTATISNRGDALADETTTRFWVRGADMDRELRIVYTPAVPPGDEVEVTATWDVRDCRGDYVITVTADAFSQIEEVNTDNNSASVRVAVADSRADIESTD